MPKPSAVTRDHVLLAVEEYDQLGDEEFLTEYGSGQARDYVLRHDGRDYDSKAVLGAAHWHATGKPATSQQYADGKEGAAKVLRALGFDVAYLAHASDDDEPATGRWMEASDVGTDAARTAWADAARDVLVDTAGTYRATIAYKELATIVQSRSGIRSSQLMHYWIGDVLSRVSADCAERGEPLLGSLCVNAAGSVGEGYAEVVKAARGKTPADADDDAAQERLACYSFFGAALPSDGGVPALTPQVSAARTRARKARALDKPVVLCPTCNMQMPVAAPCNYCD
ncbi:MAG: hypothetical protein M3Y66_01255 [Actinomycetota bacterium]|nr:hypothetical protein [Actinomycetota bacterium]